MWNRCLTHVLAASLFSAGLVGCPGEEDLLAPTPTFSIGGTIAGATGLLTLQNSNGTSLTVSANGSFAFATQMVNGATYNVTVVVPPSSQTCQVNNGAGMVGISNITQVAISCGPARSHLDEGHQIKLAALTRD